MFYNLFLGRRLQLSALAFFAIFVFGCSNSGSSNSPSGFVTTEGTRWLDAQGQPLNLRGTNLGNWLLQEFWMMAQRDQKVSDQCTLEATLDTRFGFAERKLLMTLFRDNWITERDWDLMADF